MTIAEAVAQIRDGMTIGIGGWGSRRKPMALVRAIARSGLRDLTVVSYGGPDVGLLIAAGCVSRLVCGFVSLDSIPLEPHFRRARKEGRIRLTEVDEGMLRAEDWDLNYRIRAGGGRIWFTPELHVTYRPRAGVRALAAQYFHYGRWRRGGRPPARGHDPLAGDQPAPGR